MKKGFIYSLLLGCSLITSGCSAEKASSQPVPKIYQVDTPITKSKTNTIKITNKQMTEFFSNYLTIDETTILELNQKPKQIDDGYWGAYNTYKTKTNEVLGNYLSSDAQKKLEKQYVQDDFHYPRLLEINDYMMIGILEVEEARITSKAIQNGNHVYDVMVIAIIKAISLANASKKYKWDDYLGYYILNTELQEEIEGEAIEEDKIKVTLNYLVEIADGETFKVSSVREKPGMYLGIDQQSSSKNNSFITRLPYTDYVKDNHKEKIIRFLDVFMKREYDFYSYYTKAYNTNDEIMRVVLEEDLGLKGLVNIKKDYQSQFNLLIIPLKDDIDLITFNCKEDIQVKPYISSSENYPAYEVKLNAKATLLDGRTKDYEYIYQFTFENDMILSVRFTNQLER